MSEYNGWTNYETWLVHLYLTNDDGSMNYWEETSRIYLDEAKGNVDDARYLLAQRLENDHEDARPSIEIGVFCDLLNSALSAVEWREIAQALIDNVIEEWKASQAEGEAE